MSLYPFPASLPAPSRTRWRWLDDQVQLRSLLGSSLQRVGFNGGVWAVDVVMPTLRGDSHRLLQSWLLKISVSGNWGQFVDHAYQRAGAGGGSMLVKGASQSGTTLELDNATAGITGILKEGDRIGLANGRLVMVAEDADSDSSGDVTVELVRPIVLAPDNNSGIEIDAPAIVCVPSDPSVGWDNTPPDFGGHAFTLIQDITSGVPAPVY